MRIIASRVGRSRARPPIGASALGVAARIYALAATSGDATYDRTICPREARGRSTCARASKRAPFFAGYTEGIINICYSTYSARAAPFHPTTRRAGRTLNTLSPSLYVHVAYTRVPNRRIAVLAIDRERKPLSPRTFLLASCSYAQACCLSFAEEI